MLRSIGQILVTFGVTSAGFALAGPSFAAVVPQSLSLGGQLYGSDGQAIVSTSVNFKVEVLDAAATCVLYSERHLAENLSVSLGRFNLILGQGTARVNNLDSSTSFNAAVLGNSGTVAVANCAQPTVALNAGDAREVRISYDLGGGFVALTPNVPLVSSGYALVADTVQGKAAADLIQVVDNGTTVLNQANQEYAFSAVNWPRFKALLDGTSTQYLNTSPTLPVSLNGQRLTNLADPTAAQNAATKNYVDTFVAGKPVDVTAIGPMTGNGSVLKWDATTNKWVAGLIDTSATGTAGGDLQGSYPSPTVKDDAITARKIASTGGGVNRLLITDPTTGTTVGYGVCAINEVYAWTASGWACTAVATLAPVTKVAGRTGNVVLNAADIAGLGTAALQDYGTAANQVVRLDAGARLPSVDGSLITNVNAVALQGRMIAATAPTLSQVLGFNVSSSQWEPTTLPAGNTGTITNVGTGTGLLGGPITTSGTLSVDVGAAAGKIVQENASAQIAQTFGTAALPAYSFVGNTNTGLFSPGAGQLSLASNGVAALTTLANGNVGIGTTAPAGILDVSPANAASGNGAGLILRSQSAPSASAGAILIQGGDAMYAGGDITLQTGNGSGGQGAGSLKLATGTGGVSAANVQIWTAGVQRAVFDKFGNVGVGTTAPQSGFDINTTGPIASALIVPRDSTAMRPTTAINGMLRYNTALNVMEGYINGAWSALASGSSAGTITNITTSTGLLGGPITTNGTLSVDVGATAGKIVQENPSAQIAQLNGTAGVPSYAFSGAADTGVYSPGAGQLALSSAGTARLSILGSGNVGIGVAATAPTALLYVSAGGVPNGSFSPAGGDVFVAQNAGGVGAAAKAYIISGDGSGATLFLGNASQPQAGKIAYADVTKTMTLRSNLIDAMTINGLGNVGIGTTSAQAGLDINTTGTIASAIIVPRDTTAMRPTVAVNGMLRYNTATSKFEAFENNAWTNLIGGAQPSFPLLASPIGTAAAPAYSFNANANTGLFSPAANQVAISTNGNTAATFAANGSLGLGTTTPAAQLDINFSGNSRAPSGGGSVLNISGNLWIDNTTAAAGTAAEANFAVIAPSNIYSSNGVTTTNVSGLKLFNPGNGGNETIVNSNALYIPGLYMGNTAATNGFGVNVTSPSGATNIYGGSFTAKNLLQSVTTAAAVNAYVLNSSGNVANAYGVQVAAPFVNSGSIATYYGLYVATPTAATTNYAVYSQGGTNYFGGNVGIGTTAPQAGLDINTTGTIASAIIVPRDTTAMRPTNAVNGMLRYNTATSKFEAFENSAWTNLIGGAQPSFPLLANPTGTAAAPAYSFLGNANTGVYSPGAGQVAISASGTAALTILGNGNVGIGTTAPAAPLSLTATSMAASGTLNHLLISGTETANSASSATYNGANISLNVTGGGNNSGSINGLTAAIGVNSNATQNAVNGVYTNAAHYNNPGFVSSLAGTFNDTQNNSTVTNGYGALNKFSSGGSGATTSAYGSYDLVTASSSSTMTSAYGHYAQITNASTGAITNAYGNYVAAPTKTGSGAITNYYGLYVATPTVAGSNYAVYAQGGTNYFGGNVGVGTTAPGATLEVSAASLPSFQLTTPTQGRFFVMGGANGAGQYSSIAVANDAVMTTLSSGGNTILSNATGGKMMLATGGNAGSDVARLTILTGGNIGIGTTAPQAGLDIATTGTIASALIVPRDTTANRPTVAVNGMLRYNNTLNVMEAFVNNSWQTLASQATGGTGFLPLTGGTMTGAIVNANGTVGAPSLSFANDATTGLYSTGAGVLNLATAGTARMTVTSNGFVGLGTTTPNQQLELTGSLRMPASTSATTGVIYKGAAPFIHDFTVASSNGQNTFVGLSSGNFTMTAPSASNASANAALGYMTLNAMTTGYQNAVVGANALKSETAGYANSVLGANAMFTASGGANNNTAVGLNALYALTTGYNNTAVGSTALYNTTGIEQTAVGAGALANDRGAGNRNAAMGVNALGNKWAGDFNVALGFNAAYGVYAATINNSVFIGKDSGRAIGTSTGNTFLGYSAGSTVTTGNNNLMIGNNAQAASATADNQLNIGNLIYGNMGTSLVGIGTATPGAGLDIATTGTIASALIVPRDTTANRPTVGVNGMIRYNTALSKFEAFENNAWTNMIGGGQPGFPLLANPNGTAAAPAYSFNGNANTGMFSPGAGQVSLSANGTAALSILANGNVGLGTTAPAAKLDVWGPAKFTFATGEKIVFGDSSGNNPGSLQFLFGATYLASNMQSTGGSFTMPNPYGGGSMIRQNSGQIDMVVAPAAASTVSNFAMSIAANGNVGIGNTTPAAGLDIATTGTIGSAIIVPRDSTAMRPTNAVNGMIRYNTSNAKFEAFENNAWTNLISGAQPGFPLLANPIGTAAAPAYSFSGNANTGMYSPAANQVAIATNGTAAVSIAANGDTIFNSTTNSGGSSSGAVRVLGGLGVAGQVSAGSSVIAPTLTAYAGTGGAYTASSTGLVTPYSTSILISNPVSIDGATSSLRLQTYNAAAAGQNAYVGAVANTSGNTPSIVFGQQTGASAYNERMRIDAAGNVGIGTATPGAGLDIATTGATASAVIVPRDSTANRPTVGVNGMIRYNTSNAKFEAFENNAWTNLIGGAQPGFPLLANPIGTAAAPAYSFSGNANTGMYSPAVNQLAFATNGTAALGIGADGSVGIGTTTPSFSLSLGGATAARTLGMEPASSGNGNNLFISAGGTAPGTSNGSGGSLTLSSGAVTGFGGSQILFNTADTNFGGGTTARATTTRMWLTSGGRLGIGEPYPTTNLTVVAPSGITARLTAANFFAVGNESGLEFSAQNSGYLQTSFAQVFGGVTTTTSGSEDGYFRIATKRTGTMTEVARFDKAGNVGIGTITPAARLDVNGPVKLGATGTAVSGVGVCSVASYTPTNSTSNVTCSGVPASTAVAVNCSPSGPFSDPNATVISARATGTAGSIAVNLSAANTNAVTLTCMWMAP